MNFPDGPLTGAPLGFVSTEPPAVPVYVTAANPTGTPTRTVAGIIPIDGTITEIRSITNVDATSGTGDLRLLVTDSTTATIQIVTLQTAPIVEQESFTLAVSIPVSAGDLAYEIRQGPGVAGEVTVTVKVTPG